MKESGPAEYEEIDRTEHGVGWIAYPDETMQRASHALADGDDVWVVDPVDADGVDDLFAEYGEVAGVVILLDRHKRDCAAIANRHDVSVWVPSFMDGVTDELDAPVERFRHDLGESGFGVHEVVNNRFWQEALLYNEDTGVLVVSEAVGTTEYFRAGRRELGVHPALRLRPPKKLTRLEPEHLRVGHGAGLHGETAPMLRNAVESARARTPALYWKNFKMLVT